MYLIFQSEENDEKGYIYYIYTIYIILAEVPGVARGILKKSN